jgi:4'-phosphopantetheinyl transferase EntD
VLTEVLPSGVAVCEIRSAGLGAEERTATLLAEEERALGEVCPARRRDFTLGRVCARRALAALDEPPAAILPGAHRQPIWPAGIVGSITHCAGYWAAAAARERDFLSVGFDAEPHWPLPDGVSSMIARPAEQAWLRRLAGSAVRWDRLLFSAKESVYKAWFPIAGRWLGMEDVEVSVLIEARTFHARLLVAGPVVDGAALTGFHGRYLVGDGLVLTAVAVPRSGAGRLGADGSPGGAR